MAKAAFWVVTDVEARKCGEQTGLDTLVVHTVNVAHWVYARLFVCAVANALSVPPGEYARKGETQRN